jgi:hypothetical protein
MADIRISKHPVFKKGTFHNHPDLFGRFHQHPPDPLQLKYNRLWQEMPQYEGIITWQMVTGPGFQGATHPGADTVFVGIMAGYNRYVYNSDCLYVNPGQKVFAISDPPGITTSSRRLFERLDHALKTSTDGLKKTVNRLSEQTRPEEGATMSLVYLPEEKSHTAQLVIAGDTFLFHGNAAQRTIRVVTGRDEFFGTPYASLEVQDVALEPGDFFLIASDGILSLTGTDPERNLAKALCSHLDGNLGDFVHRVMLAANNCYRKKIYGRTFSRFGGNDNVSLLLVYPEQLAECDASDSIILGGYIEERR